MAVENPLFTITLAAGADLSAKQFLAVVPTAGKAAVAGAGVKCLGVLQNKPTADQAATVVVHGITKAIAGAAITAGAQVEVNAQGEFITLNTGVSVGFALDAAAGDGSVFTLCLK